MACIIYFFHYWGEFDNLLNLNKNPLIKGRACVHHSNYLLIKWKCIAQKETEKKDKTHPQNRGFKVHLSNIRRQICSSSNRLKCFLVTVGLVY